MQLIDKNNHNEIKKIIQYLKYKKILIVSGSSSFSSSKAEKILNDFTKNKVTSIFLKKKKSTRFYGIIRIN